LHPIFAFGSFISSLFSSFIQGDGLQVVFTVNVMVIMVNHSSMEEIGAAPFNIPASLL
jgi:hypothetical protein